MIRYLFLLIASILALETAAAAPRADVVVVDSVSLVPLPDASVYDRHGKAVGVTDRRGILPHIAPRSYPLTIRYIGFDDKTVASADCDTIFLHENYSELPEVVVESSRRKVLHILAYVREYSTMATFTDTVSLFREKMVDYMITPDRKMKFKGWSTPRILSCKSYYRFTDSAGLDSVSDVSNNHFSWADWIGVAPETPLPDALSGADAATATVRGKYSATETWTKQNDRIRVDVDVLADTAGRKWVPNLSGFFRQGLDFERFRVKFEYEDVVGDSVSPGDLSRYSFEIESNGRGHEMFMFNRHNEPFSVNTSAEVYILDREYITVKEAKRWAALNIDLNELGIYVPADAPALQPWVENLICRVNNIDKEMIRLNVAPDRNLVSPFKGRNCFSIGYRLLSMLKTVTGITRYKYNRNLKRRWNDFRSGQMQKNNKHATTRSDNESTE